MTIEINRNTTGDTNRNTTGDATGGTVTVTDADFADRVLGSKTPVLLEFWAPWCPPCRMLAPVLDQIAADHAGRLTVAKLNTDENPATVTASHVTANPTLQVYRDGELLLSVVGARSRARLLSEVAQVLPELATA
jgi:thioredoxin 1